MKKNDETGPFFCLHESKFCQQNLLCMGVCALKNLEANKCAELHSIMQALTDPENQPHQWMGDKDALTMALTDQFAKVFK